MDISDTLAPDSDQLDAVDLLGGPQTFTITNVTRNKADQPVNVHLAEFPRPWRPGKSMRRVLAACWGTESTRWVGRRVTLFCDESVTFGNDVVGGTRISHLSHIDGVKRVPLLVSRGRSATFVVQPLRESAGDRAASYRAEWKLATPERRKWIEEQVTKLTGTSAEELQDEAAAAGGHPSERVPWLSHVSHGAGGEPPHKVPPVPAGRRVQRRKPPLEVVSTLSPAEVEELEMRVGPTAAARLAKAQPEEDADAGVVDEPVGGDTDRVDEPGEGVDGDDDE